MQVILKKLAISNFKGIKEKEIDFTEKTNISGDNATGKSTIFDAYSWLLWGKDSLNRKDYEIKPYDENNDIIYHIEPTVEGVFDVDGKEMTFKRVYKEKWAPRRNIGNELFTGNKTDFYINEVPIKMGEYKEKIGQIITEDEFNLLSNPKYFNEILNKKERRDILLSLVKDVSVDDVKEANPELEKLDLSIYTIEEIQAMAKATSKKINDRKKEIPARIDELEKAKNNEDFAELEAERRKLKKEVDELDKILAGSRFIGDELDEKYTEISKIKGEIVKINSDFEDGKNQKLKELEEEHADLRRKITMAEFELNNARKEIEVLDRDIQESEKNIEKCEKYREELLVKFRKIQQKKFDGNLSCPTCGKEFDADKKEEIVKHFNLEKSKRKEEINKEGESNNETIALIKKDIEASKTKKENKQTKIDKLSKSLVTIMHDKELIQGQIEKAKALSLCNKKVEEIKSLEEKIKTIEEEIANIGKEDNSQILSQKQAYNKRLDEVNTKLSNQGLNAELDEKIKKYMDEEKELGKEFEIQQEKLYLCEEYIKTYTHLVSDKINDLFTKVEFKLFDTQINGGIVETAEATYKGVPYGSLNSAAQINAGLDVINSLSKHYKKEIPIFVDNAESVNELVETQSQLITLSVSKYKSLRVENI